MELGWIDYSEADRKRAMSVIAGLEGSTAIDELGIGLIRDAFSNAFFPATSTIMTRAKYFFVVPYALRDLENYPPERKGAASIRKAYDDVEREIAQTFMKEVRAPDGSVTGHGVVGARSLNTSGKWVKRGPAVIYWSALRQLGILKDEDIGYGSYFRYIEKLPSLEVTSEEDDPSGCFDDIQARDTKWHIPNDEYADWFDWLTLDLTEGEAAFLKGQIEKKFPDSLFAMMLVDDDVWDAAVQSVSGNVLYSDEDAQQLGAGDAFYGFCGLTEGMLPRDLHELCRLACRFSDFNYALQIRYNSQLAGHEEGALEEWDKESESLIESIGKLDVDELFFKLNIGGSSLAEPLRGFLKQCQKCIIDDDISGLDAEIRRRESDIKHDRAKIGRTEGVPEGWRGSKRLAYRFNIAHGFAREIREAGASNA